MIFDIHAHYGQWLSTSVPDTEERFSRLLDRFHIDASIVSSGRAIQCDLTAGNAEVAGLIERDKRVYGAIVVNPNHIGESLAELERYGRNRRWVAVKHHPDYSGVMVDAPSMTPIIRRTVELGLPLFVHTWGAAQIDASCAVAKAFPGLPVFLFHMGGDLWRMAVEKAASIPNTYLEIISSVPEPRRIREAVETLGAGRVFFGTDMTLITPAAAFGLVKGAGLSEGDATRVMGLNALELFASRIRRKPGTGLLC